MRVKKRRVCVLVPVYNEGPVVRDVLLTTKEVFDDQKKFQIDIVVVNDGSTDTTAAEVEKTGCIVINHVLNSGQGAAILTGLNYALKHDYEIVACMDGDGQHLPSDVLKGIIKLQDEDYDFLVGSRMIDSSGMSRVKVIGNTGLTLLTFLLFGSRSTDSQSGLRVFSRKAVEQLRWKSTGYEFASEMLWRANQLRLRSADYPIKAVYTSYSISRGQNNWNAINIVKTLLKRRIVELFG